MIFSDIKQNIRKDLDDIGVTFYSTDDLTDSVTDAYKDINLKTHCIIKKSAGLSWIANLSYIDFRTDYLITDYIATTAIYNNNTNRFLDDNMSLQQFNLIRWDWEINTGEPDSWAPSDFKRIAIMPRQASANGTFDLFYWADTPSFVDTDTPLIATDMQDLIEKYCVADLLEQAEEFVKAQTWWEEYDLGIEEYADRVATLAKADLMLLA